jgi:uncharacterized protein (TIGR01777 family)
VREFVQRVALAVPADAVFAWHARPGALERLLPPWQTVRVVERHGEGVEPGTRVVLRVGPGPLARRWEALHDRCVAGREFRDVQVCGPFAAWTHVHRFVPDGPERSVLEDHVTYALPLAALAEPLLGGWVDGELRRMFAFRHARTREDLARHRGVGGRPRRIAVTGASGFLGRALCAFLTTGGHTVVRVGRGARAPDTVAWDPARGTIDADGLAGVDAVVHLAGAPVATRWTAAAKRAIRASRVDGTRLLAETLARLPTPPSVLVGASAIGWYGDAGDAPVDESAAAGPGFLAEVCRAWEAATAPAAAAGIRVVHARLGVVLGAQGGALAQMLGPFRLGVGGVVGSGRQVTSWIALDDAVYALHHLLHADGVACAVNLTAPHAVTNAELTRTLARVLRRPAIVPVPAAVVRTLFGEMGEEMLLAGARVVPGALVASGYRFLHPELEGALRAELGR